LIVPPWQLDEVPDDRQPETESGPWVEQKRGIRLPKALEDIRA